MRDRSTSFNDIEVGSIVALDTPRGTLNLAVESPYGDDGWWAVDEDGAEFLITSDDNILNIEAPW